MKASTAVAYIGCVALLASGCSGSSDSKGGSALVNGQTFSMALKGDPGTLDPAFAVSGYALEIDQFLYDTMTKVDTDGKDVPNLAAEWKVSATKAIFTLRKGITCGDGTKLKASTVAKNFDFIGNEKNSSPLLGLSVQAGTTAVGDDAANTVTVTSGGPDPFLLRNLSDVAIVCEGGLANRKLLRAGADGTGMYTLKKASANDRYTLALRDGYAWAPGSGALAKDGVPTTVVVRVVPNETTSSNLLLSGELNAAEVQGADTKRLDAQKLNRTSTYSPSGQMFFNEAKSRPASDEAVRSALVAGVNLDDLLKVITDGKGVRSKGMVTVDPQVCKGDPTKNAFPTFDESSAKKSLDAAGWSAGSGGIRTKDGQKLTLKVLYAASDGAQMAAGMEFVQTAWKKLGVDVQLVGADNAKVGQVLDETGDWDVSFVGLGLLLPSQLVPFVSGAASPNGLNSGSVENTEYTRLVDSARQKTGVAGCDDWNAAESALYKRVDVVPFGTLERPWFSKKATFALVGGLVVPSSIRMTAS